LSFHTAVNVLGEAIVRAKQIGLANIVFQKMLAGFDNPRGNSLLVLKSAGGYVLTALGLGIFSYGISRLKSKHVRFILILLFGIIDIFICAHMGLESVWLVLRGVPLVLAVVIAMKYCQFFRKSSENKDLSNLLFQIVFLTYALLLMFRILLFANPFHYGFVLAVPGTLMIAVMLVHDLACFCRGKFYYPKVFRALGIVFLSGVLILYFRWNKSFYECINCPIGRGQDQFLSFDADVIDRGYDPVLINDILQWIDKNTSSKDTLTVMPEGVMINYLARRQNPLPEYVFFPGVVDFFGEDKIIDLFKKAAPLYIILIHRDTSEYGAQTFGVGYGKRIYQWIVANYQDILFFGELPSKRNNNHFISHAVLMKRNAS